MFASLIKIWWTTIVCKTIAMKMPVPPTPKTKVRTGRSMVPISTTSTALLKPTDKDPMGSLDRRTDLRIIWTRGAQVTTNTVENLHTITKRISKSMQIRHKIINSRFMGRLVASRRPNQTVATSSWQATMVHRTTTVLPLCTKLITGLIAKATTRTITNLGRAATIRTLKKSRWIVFDYIVSQTIPTVTMKCREANMRTISRGNLEFTKIIDKNTGTISLVMEGMMIREVTSIWGRKMIKFRKIFQNKTYLTAKTTTNKWDMNLIVETIGQTIKPTTQTLTKITTLGPDRPIKIDAPIMITNLVQMSKMKTNSSDHVRRNSGP